MKNILLLFLNQFSVNSSNNFEHKIFRWDSKDIDCIHPNQSSVTFIQDRLLKKDETLDAIFYFSPESIHQKIPSKKVSHEDFFKTLPMNAGKPFKQKIFHAMNFVYPKKSEDNIQLILQMVNEIQNFSNDVDDIKLHIDISNCNATLLLATAQILSYKKIQTGFIIYSNPYNAKIENVAEIYKMSQLFDGVSEFINFCSVQSIEKYFEGRKISPELQNLLDKIRKFDNAIAICRTAELEKLSAELREAMIDFAFLSQKTLQEKIFLNLLEIFETEYHDILKEDLSRIDIIHYCARKNFLQQAMTLCTEWLPVYFVQRRFFYPQNPDVQRIVDQTHIRWEQTFIINFSNAVSRFFPDQQIIPLEIAKDFKLALSDIIAFDETFTAEKIGIVNEKVDQIFSAIDRTDEVLQPLRSVKNPKDQLQKTDQDVFKLTELAFKKYSYPNTNFDSFINKKATKKVLARGLQMSSDAAIVKMFEFDNPTKTRLTETNGLQSTKIQWTDFFKAKGVLSDFDHVVEKLAAVLKKYSAIREQRNLINHASEKTVLTNGQIRQMILDCLESIRDLERIPENSFINHTTRHYKLWSTEKIIAAEKFGDVYDIPFPTLNPSLDEEQIAMIAKDNAERIASLKPAAVLCQGDDLSYVFAVVSELKSKGILVLFATGGTNFNQFRSYETLPND